MSPKTRNERRVHWAAECAFNLLVTAEESNKQRTKKRSITVDQVLMHMSELFDLTCREHSDLFTYLQRVYPMVQQGETGILDSDVVDVLGVGDVLVIKWMGHTYAVPFDCEISQDKLDAKQKELDRLGIDQSAWLHVLMDEEDEARKVQPTN